MIVCKFGGTSTTTKAALENIFKISKSKKRKIFVFSALGKFFDKDKKITDLLIDFTLKRDKKILKEIEEKFSVLKKQTNINMNSRRYFLDIEKSNDQNYIISRGEYITAKIMAKYLHIKYIPAEKIITFENGNIDKEKTKHKLQMFLKKHKRICTGGFYGFDAISRKIVLFNRGGGDTTGALISLLLGAKIYEVYTDISGVKVANPNIVKNPKVIKKISYQDMDKISSCDGKVLHKSVCEILFKSKTKIKVINTFCLKENKTTIDNKNHKVRYICFKEQDANNIIYVKNVSKKCEYACKKEVFEEFMNKIYQEMFKEKK